MTSFGAGAYGSGAYGGISRNRTSGGSAFGFQVYVRDQHGLRQGELTTYTSASFKPLYNDVGVWSVTLDRRDPVVPLLVTPGWGIEVRRAGNLIISGPANYRQHAVAGSSTPQTNQLTVSGFSDEVWLKRRVCLPNPATPVTQGVVYTTASAYATYGPTPASTAILAVVNDNLGPGALTNRQLANLSLAADPVTGTNVTQTVRFDNLLTIVQAMALAGGVGFRLAPNGDGTFSFSVYANTDRTGTVKFSPALGNVSDFTYDDTAPVENWEHVLGSSTSTTDPRTQSVMDTSDAVALGTWGMMEGVSSDTTDNTAAPMTTAAVAQLVQNSEQATMTAAILENPGSTFAQDFFIGDRVTFQLEDWVYTPAGGGSIQDIVRSVDIELLSGQAPTTSIGVGSPKVTQVSKLFSTIKAQQVLLQRLAARAK